ncbi:MAG TPA: Flp pilus assembly protein CpaB [Chroococcales cyanobacterium]
MPTQVRPTSKTGFSAWEKSAWDKNPATGGRDPKKKGNPLAGIMIGAIVILGASGLWRTMHTTPKGAFVDIVAVNKDTPAGVNLSLMQVHFTKVPKQFVTADMVTNLNEVNGQVVKTFIQANDLVSKDKLFPNKAVSSTLENHERAITLQLTDEALVDHTIQPDDRVDVLAVTTKDSKKYTKPICQDARVLMATAKEQTLAKRMGGSSTANRITLAVTPDLAEKLTEAMETGKLRLLLRNRLSRVEHHLAGVSPEDLLPTSASNPAATTIAAQSGIAKQETALPAPPPIPQIPAIPAMPSLSEIVEKPAQWMVEVFSGNKKDMYAFPQHDN